MEHWLELFWERTWCTGTSQLTEVPAPTRVHTPKVTTEGVKWGLFGRSLSVVSTD